MLHLFVVRHHGVLVNNFVPDIKSKTPQLPIPKALSSLLHVDFAEMVQIQLCTISSTPTPYLLLEVSHHIGDEDLCVVLVADLAGAVEHPGDLVTPGQQGLHDGEQLEEVTLGPHLVDKHHVISMADTREKRKEG